LLPQGGNIVSCRRQKNSPPPPGIWPPEAAVFGHRSWPNTPPYGGQGLAAGEFICGGGTYGRSFAAALTAATKKLAGL
jgi:hypothetical protein